MHNIIVHPAEDTPLLDAIIKAKEDFYREYGFKPESLYLSVQMAKAMERMASGFSMSSEAVNELLGMEMFHQNKAGWVFWLVARKDGQVYSSECRIEPDSQHQIIETLQ